MAPSSYDKNSLIARARADYRPDIVQFVPGISLETAQQLIEYKNTLKRTRALLALNEALNVKKSFDEQIAFLLGFNSINYHFWRLNVIGNKRVFTRYERQGELGAIGAYSGFTALYNDLEQGLIHRDDLAVSDMDNYFGDIPDSMGRLKILKESLNPDNVNACIAVLITALSQSPRVFTTATAHLIATLMPLSFQEPYLKKIQLALYQIANYMNESNQYQPSLQNSREQFVACDITVAADYQVPKVLEGMGILKYSAQLTQQIKSYCFLDTDSPEELAIRAATILACEHISQTQEISIANLDRFLWLSRNSYLTPHHLTITTRY